MKREILSCWAVGEMRIKQMSKDCYFKIIRFRVGISFECEVRRCRPQWNICRTAQKQMTPIHNGQFKNIQNENFLFSWLKCWKSWPFWKRTRLTDPKQTLCTPRPDFAPSPQTLPFNEKMRDVWFGWLFSILANIAMHLEKWKLVDIKLCVSQFSRKKMKNLKKTKTKTSHFGTSTLFRCKWKNHLCFREKVSFFWSPWLQDKILLRKRQAVHQLGQSFSSCHAC